MIFRKAILIIHGFAGGTYDEEELANYLEINRKFDVYQFTLPGHNKNLSKVKYQQWIKSCESKIEWLINNNYNSIYIIGHSMGGVIATYLSSKYKQVKKLVLLAPAFHYLSVTNSEINIKENLKVASKVLESYGGSEIFSRFLKLDISAVREFMMLVKTYYNSPRNVSCPVLIIQGENDDVVPESSSEYVYNTLMSHDKKLVYISGVDHEICVCERKYEIFEIIEDFLKYKNKGGIDRI